LRVEGGRFSFLVTEGPRLPAGEVLQKVSVFCWLRKDFPSAVLALKLS